LAVCYHLMAHEMERLLIPGVDLAEIADPVLQALEASGIGFVVTRFTGDADPVRIYVSPRAAEIVGKPAEELIGTPGFASVSADEVERVRELSRALFAAQEGTDFKFETVIQRPDGEHVPVEVGSTRVRYQGQPAYVSFFWDICERKQTERRLALSEERFRKLIDSAPDAVFISQGETLIFTNPAMAAMLGHARVEDLVGGKLREMMHPEDAQRTASRIVEIERARGPHPPVVRRIRHKDGSWVHVEVVTMGIDFDGKPSIIGYGRDLTARRALQAQLLQADRMAAVGALAAGVAHEINNPLAYVMLNLDLVMRQLRRDATSPRAAELADKLAEAREGAERVALIVKDLLSFARSEESWGPINLRDVVDGAIKMVRSELRGRAQLELDWGDLPPVDGNSARLGQVFLNLMINAIQALPTVHPEKNRIHIVAREERGFAVVEVRDNGGGIGEASLPHIFEPFYTTKPAGEGTGLGLSICHSIVTSMGGDLTARNADDGGGGAVFRVALPRSGHALARS
jgi:two-component system NtrC family sensor kinase